MTEKEKKEDSSKKEKSTTKQESRFKVGSFDDCLKDLGLPPLTKEEKEKNLNI